MRRIVSAVLCALVLGGCVEEGTSSGGHSHGENSAVVEGARQIGVTGAALRFDPAEIQVTAGEDVTIVFTAADVAHDFTIAELGVHVGADGGETAEGGLRADEPGTYTYVCTLPGHGSDGMRGTLVVTGA